jgi:hypothetical protein
MNDEFLQKRSERTKRKSFKYAESDSDDDRSNSLTPPLSISTQPPKEKTGKKRGRKPGAGGVDGRIDHLCHIF